MHKENYSITFYFIREMNNFFYAYIHVAMQVCMDISLILSYNKFDYLHHWINAYREMIHIKNCFI